MRYRRSVTWALVAITTMAVGCLLALHYVAWLNADWRCVPICASCGVSPDHHPIGLAGLPAHLPSRPAADTPQVDISNSLSDRHRPQSIWMPRGVGLIAPPHA